VYQPCSMLCGRHCSASAAKLMLATSVPGLAHITAMTDEQRRKALDLIEWSQPVPPRVAGVNFTGAVRVEPVFHQ